MESNRREFLKQAGVAGAAAMAAGCSTTGMTQVAGSSPRRMEGGPMPRQMILVSMMVDGTPVLGVKTERGILDVRRAAMHHGSAAPTTIDEAIRYGDSGLGELVRMASAQGGAGVFHDESAVRFCPCVMNPEKIVCVGLNYARHARETNNPIPKLPILFNKFNNALNCHQGTVQVSKIPAANFDYESELVVVMGRRAQNVSEAEALSYAFGYCNGNDFTARDLQSRSSQWMIGKTCDGFGLLGPYLVTADLVDPNNLKIVGTVNGEVRQSSNTNDMVFNCAQIISYTSKLMTLQAGDIIYTGTPEGVIAGYPKEKQVWLKPGDKLETTIGNLGTLRFSLT
jgi:2-keto-4-pentenoate hydratase/2-oxohepta-3-ene-1,7-dioic acid hydratase in catechol pathway